MARNVGAVFVTNWQNLGATAPVGQWSADVEIQWTDDDGTERSWGPSTETFPNVLSDVPLTALREVMKQLIVMKARVELGISSWEELG